MIDNDILIYSKADFLDELDFINDLLKNKNVLIDNQNYVISLFENLFYDLSNNNKINASYIMKIFTNIKVSNGKFFNYINSSYILLFYSNILDENNKMYSYRYSTLRKKYQDWKIKNKNI